MSEEFLETHCCIAGGGPAGIVAGYLLARAGIDVVLIDRQQPFGNEHLPGRAHAPELLAALAVAALLAALLVL